MTAYEKQLIENDHNERLAEYRSALFRPSFSKPCKTCGKTFIGRDWRLADSDYCSEKCELASYKSLDSFTRYRVKLFWRDFGADFEYLEDISRAVYLIERHKNIVEYKEV